MKLLATFGALALLAPFALVAARPSALVPAPVPATAWEIDPVHSSVIFKVKHMNASWFYGRFNEIKGTVVLNEEKPAESKVELTIPIKSVDTNNSGRNDQLKKADFFNAEEFSSLDFTSITAKKVDKLWKIEGELTMHGVTKPLVLDVEVVGSGEMRGKKIMGFHTTFTVKRSDFGMTYMLDNLGDEVTVMAGIECQAK